MDFRNIIKKMHELDPTKPSEDLQRLTEMAESTGISMGAEERPQPTNPNPKQTITESTEVVAEKAVSKAQQKLMGQAYALKKGDMKAKDASKEVKKLAKDMSKSDLKDFASTKHKKKPEHVADKKKTKKESVELVDDFGEIVEAKKSAAQKKAQEKFKAMVKGKKADDKDSMDESSAKPDFLDIDGDGDTKEPMKKAAKDAKKKKPVKESVEPKMSFIEMMKLVQESGGQQAIDPVDDALWNWANRVAQSKIEETAKQEIFAAMVYERNGGTFEMYDVLAEQKK
jgi:hypothetical protein